MLDVVSVGLRGDLWYRDNPWTFPSLALDLYAVVLGWRKASGNKEKIRTVGGIARLSMSPTCAI